MIEFQTLVEKLKNPLRKKELEGSSTNHDYVEKIKPLLGKQKRRKIRKQEEFGVEPERIQAYKDSKLSQRERRLKEVFFRTKLDPKKYDKILEKWGIQVFCEKDLELLFKKGNNNYKIIEHSINNLVLNYRDVLPIKKFKIVIGNIPKHSIFEKSEDVPPPAYYWDRIIFIDQHSIEEPDYLVHEYAHWIVDLIPKQTYELMMREYKQMLDNYYTHFKKKKRANLKKVDDSKENKVREQWREKISKFYNLPSAYSVTDHDEFWAELITYWKRLPPNAYQFKQAIKKIIDRL